MEHIDDAAWFPGAVVTHNEACTDAVWRWIHSSRLMSAWFCGGPIWWIHTQGGIWLGIGRLCLQFWGQFLRFLLILVILMCVCATWGLMRTGQQNMGCWVHVLGFHYWGCRRTGFLFLMLRMWHFFALNFFPHFWAQASSCFRSFWRVMWSWNLLISL